jgi:hypothetical protein
VWAARRTGARTMACRSNLRIPTCKCALFSCSACFRGRLVESSEKITSICCLSSNCFSFRDITDATLVSGLEFPDDEADIDTELSDTDDYLPEVCLCALHTSCYSQPKCPHVRISIVCDFASSFYTILCMRLLPIHAL